MENNTNNSDIQQQQFKSKYPDPPAYYKLFQDSAKALDPPNINKLKNYKLNYFQQVVDVTIYIFIL